MTAPLRVLALVPAPAEAAATRFRLLQLVPNLEADGITVDVRPFLGARAWAELYDRRRWRVTSGRVLAAAVRRVADVARAQRADVVFVLREAMLAGPPLIEALATLRRPLVLDLDDPTWVAYDSPTYGRAARLVKAPGKALWLIDHAEAVTCGSTYVQRFVEDRGRRAVKVPTVADPELFRPCTDRDPGPLHLGWIGTHSTWPYLEAALPSVAAVARRHELWVDVVGAGAGVADRRVAGSLDVRFREWSMAREPHDFAALDVGLYPLQEDAWSVGKSGFKSVQYLACGVPFVVSPVGEAAAIGIPGETHLEARSPDEWEGALDRLCSDAALRRRMGAAGRAHAVATYSVKATARQVAGVLRSVA